MESTEQLLFIVALIAFLLATQTRQRSHVYVGATMLLLILVTSFAHPDRPPVQVAGDERRIEKNLINEAANLAQEAHTILQHTPHTKSESEQAQSTATHFYAEERNWLNRAEHGKPLSMFVDQNASTAAIRIVALDPFLTGAVQSSIENCNAKDADTNMALADKIIADARASLDGHGDPHFPTPDLSNQLDGSNDCSDDGG